MQTKFRRHQSVKIKRAPDAEYIEYAEDYLDSTPEIKPGMRGKINLLLPNGEYHVEILDEKENTIAYAPFSEDDLEETE